MSSSEKDSSPSSPVDEKARVVSDAAIDDAAHVVLDGSFAEDNSPLDPIVADKLRRKIDWHILPLMMFLYLYAIISTRLIQYLDKTTLNSASILGIKKTAHLDTSQYNWLSTIFYLAYLVFEYPQNLALQRFPVAKWMSINIFVWSIALAAQAACHSFIGLFFCRLILGVCEGSITAGFLIVTSFFWTHKEQSLRVGWWFLMNGSGTFGVLHFPKNSLAPWQWYMIMTGVITLILSIAFWFLFPDNPQTAWFLTAEEKVLAVRRVKENQTGVENKTFKTEQMWEAFQDPKAWLFALFNIPNAFSNQGAIIINSFGFTVIQTTLLGCVTGVVEIIAILAAIILVNKVDNSRGYVAAFTYAIAMAGNIVVLTLPWHNKVGLLFGVWIMLLGWITATTAGHTKRIVMNSMLLVGYCTGNLVGPQLFKAKYAPRNIVPFGVFLGCNAASLILLLVIRVVLARENARRDAEKTSHLDAETATPEEDLYEHVYVEVLAEDGTRVRKHVDKAFLDLTDFQNRDFRYVL
ncbi:MFS general substrate transporter [Clavulina sp. PMI_390]|nr:MFS general substrate transporter [Clavulina sp. PMI_390]